jgi:Cu(I)/Ag(I) efflux system membrane fusion protein
MSTAGNAWQVTKTIFLRLRFIFVFIVIGLIVGNWDWIMNVVERATRPPAGAAAAGDVEWFCPMHPTVVRDNDREKCPICFMPLSKRKRGETAALPPGVVQRLSLTGTRVQQAGVATEEVVYRTLTRELRTVGIIDWDERKIAHISARIAGRADELFIQFAGARVKQGDPVYRLYSPDLVTTQEEYLLALKTLGEVESSPQRDAAAVERAKRLADSAKERMRLWGIADAQLAELEKSKKAQTHVTILSPVSGLVIEKDIHAGHQVMMGEDPYTVVDDATVWMQAEVFERDLGLVREGQAVEISSEAYPDQPFTGKVAFIAPQVAAETRTVKVRVDVANPGARLKAGMYVTALLRLPVGKQGEVFWGC